MAYFMFRTKGISHGRSLIERVLTVMAGLEIEGAGVQLQTSGMRSTYDGDGDLIIASVTGPTGWHFHAHRQLDQNDLRCSIYPASASPKQTLQVEEFREPSCGSQGQPPRRLATCTIKFRSTNRSSRVGQAVLSLMFEERQGPVAWANHQHR
ncbi:hypothetical protein [Pseudoxanthomonas sp. GM95]|uniref:hypothetical protein n=1 Tax=Pseudoxanthomonas sp. GM95 TaxID=1881043 RepID=UPI000B84D8DC|nr:hypothetical protein [Pseudoxanthomonas sp. GM95]